MSRSCLWSRLLASSTYSAAWLASALSVILLHDPRRLHLNAPRSPLSRGHRDAAPIPTGRPVGYTLLRGRHYAG